MAASRVQKAAMLDVPRKHLWELRLDARRPDREHVADQPDAGSGEPELQADTDRGRERADRDRDGARRAAIIIGSVSERCSGAS